MICNPSECMELVVRKKKNKTNYVYGASESDLNIIQLFIDRCHKYRFVSSPVSIKDLLYRQGCKILKAITSVDNHPLGSYLPPTKENKII